MPPPPPSPAPPPPPPLPPSPPHAPALLDAHTWPRLHAALASQIRNALVDLDHWTQSRLDAEETYLETTVEWLPTPIPRAALVALPLVALYALLLAIGCCANQSFVRCLWGTLLPACCRPRPSGWGTTAPAEVERKMLLLQDGVRSDDDRFGKDEALRQRSGSPTMTTMGLKDGGCYVGCTTVLCTCLVRCCSWVALYWAGLVACLSGVVACFAGAVAAVQYGVRRAIDALVRCVQFQHYLCWRACVDRCSPSSMSNGSFVVMPGPEFDVEAANRAGMGAHAFGSGSVPASALASSPSKLGSSPSKVGRFEGEHRGRAVAVAPPPSPGWWLQQQEAEGAARQHQLVMQTLQQQTLQQQHALRQQERDMQLQQQQQAALEQQREEAMFMAANGELLGLVQQQQQQQREEQARAQRDGFVRRLHEAEELERSRQATMQRHREDEERHQRVEAARRLHEAEELEVRCRREALTGTYSGAYAGTLGVGRETLVPFEPPSSLSHLSPPPRLSPQPALTRLPSPPPPPPPPPVRIFSPDSSFEPGEGEDVGAVVRSFENGGGGKGSSSSSSYGHRPLRKEFTVSPPPFTAERGWLVGRSGNAPSIGGAVLGGASSPPLGAVVGGAVLGAPSPPLGCAAARSPPPPVLVPSPQLAFLGSPQPAFFGSPPPAKFGSPQPSVESAVASVSQPTPRSPRSASPPRGMSPLNRHDASWPDHSAIHQGGRFGSSTYTADAVAALTTAPPSDSVAPTTALTAALGALKLAPSPPPPGPRSPSLMLPMPPMPPPRAPVSTLGGNCARSLEITAAAAHAEAAWRTPAVRVQVIQQYVQAALAAVVGPAHAAAGSAERRFALQASIEAQWSTHWAQVQPAELLKDTAISARELLAAEPQTLSHVAAEIRAQFEALEATFTYYAAAYSSAESSAEPGEPSAEMGAFGLTGAAAAGQSRAMSEAAWLQFAAAAALGAVGDLSWFASPNEIAAAAPRARREVGERALFKWVLDRRRERLRAAAARRPRSVPAAPRAIPSAGGGGGFVNGLTFAEFLQALLLTCWRRVALPPPDDYVAAAGRPAGSSGAPKGMLVRAVREVLGRAVLPAAERLDVLAFRRALAGAATVHAAMHALQPMLELVFEFVSTAPAAAAGAVPSAELPRPMALSFADFARLVGAAGLLEAASGLGLQPPDLAGAFVASLSSHSASALSYDGFVEALVRTAATCATDSDAAAGAWTSAAAAKVAAVAAQAAASMPPGSPTIAHPITMLPEARVLARLPELLARVLLATLPGRAVDVDMTVERLQLEAIGRARDGAQRQLAPPSSTSPPRTNAFRLEDAYET